MKLSRLVLRRLGPLAPWIVAAQAAIAARDHWRFLTPGEQRHLIELVKQGRPKNFSEADRRELRRLVGKLHPAALGRRIVTGHRLARP